MSVHSDFRSGHHFRAAIISQGDEIVLGQTLDTNSKWLADQLLARGITPVEQVSLPDDVPAITAAFRRLSASVDLILCTGGLGPTADDLTREALAAAEGDTLVEDPAALAQIERWFKDRGRPMPVINRVQAMRPRSATTIENFHGTAPGIQARVGGADVFCMPGPPRELFPMFEEQVAFLLRPPTARSVRTLALHIVGLGESDVATSLSKAPGGDMMARERVPLVGTTASGGVVTARIRYEGPLPASDADALVRRTADQVRSLLGAHVFAENGTPHEELPAAVIEALRERGRTLAVVESCTAGLLGSMIGDIPGASGVFLGGVITYANALKSSLAGVPAAIFEGPASPGSVSFECASAMAIGGLRATGATDCLSITGIAGPGGATPTKPVGTVFIALATSGTTGVTVDARRFNMAGDRRSVREWSARAAMAMLWMRMSGAPETRLLREVDRRASEQCEQ
ncbi:MAG: CinA family nicotinamide mononucleotide deamidase-related protein [Planctomycetota bacterium]